MHTYTVSRLHMQLITEILTILIQYFAQKLAVYILSIHIDSYFLMATI